MSTSFDSLPLRSGPSRGRTETSLVSVRTGEAAPLLLSRGARPSGAGRSVLFCGETMGPLDRESVQRHAGDALEAARCHLGRDPLVGEGDSWRQRSAGEFCRGLAIARSVGAGDAARLGGYGLGEIVAMSIAGFLGAEEGLVLATARGGAVDAARLRDPAAGSLLIHGEPDSVARLARRFGLSAAVVIDDDQSVYAGPRWVLDVLRDRARRSEFQVEVRGAPALHSPSMEPARAALLQSPAAGVDLERTAPGVIGPAAEGLSISERISSGLVGAIDVRVLCERLGGDGAPARIGEVATAEPPEASPPSGREHPAVR